MGGAQSIMVGEGVVVGVCGRHREQLVTSPSITKQKAGSRTGSGYNLQGPPLVVSMQPVSHVSPKFLTPPHPGSQLLSRLKGHFTFKP